MSMYNTQRVRNPASCAACVRPRPSPKPALCCANLRLSQQNTRPPHHCGAKAVPECNGPLPPQHIPRSSALWSAAPHTAQHTVQVSGTPAAPPPPFPTGEHPLQCLKCIAAPAAQRHEAARTRGCTSYTNLPLQTHAFMPVVCCRPACAPSPGAAIRGRVAASQHLLRCCPCAAPALPAAHPQVGPARLARLMAQCRTASVPGACVPACPASTRCPLSKSHPTGPLCHLQKGHGERLCQVRGTCTGAASHQVQMPRVADGPGLIRQVTCQEEMEGHLCWGQRHAGTGCSWACCRQSIRPPAGQ
jgi:hypothetical protein